MVAPGDFSLALEGTINAEIILSNPRISLYCLDAEHRQALFVETAADVNLANHPFYYQAQYDHAERVLVVSWETLNQLAAQPVPGGESPILIYSVGRCGSTLLSRAFGRLPEVQSLSEPDVFTQIAALRQKDGSRDLELTQLIRSCTQLLNKSTSSQPSTLALKFRSFSIEIADLFQSAFPQSKALFLYRNAEAWAGSAARAFDASPSTATTSMWLSVMERYLDLHAHGISMLAVRYETLTSLPVPALEIIFEFCGLPPARVSLAQQAFASDSQAGTSLSRHRLQTSAFVLTSDHRSQIRSLLSHHSTIQNPGFIVPNTAMSGAEAALGANF